MTAPSPRDGPAQRSSSPPFIRSSTTATLPPPKHQQESHVAYYYQVVVMFGRGSPKINLMQVAYVQSKSSPRSGKWKKRSPKAKSSRANWSPGLEKGLVQILRDHDNDCYRGQNGWSSETWNLMVQKFQQQFPYVSFSKDQIQDKEKELKRDFKVLKEARKQSGVHWDDKLCMIIAEPPIWDNIIMSHPKASKFQRQGFPLYDDLEKLYEGKTAEGKLSFISIEPKEDDDVSVIQPPVERVKHDRAMGSLAFLSGYNDDELDDDDGDVRIYAATSSRRDASGLSSDKRDAAKRNEESAEMCSATRKNVRRKRKQNGNVAEMMERYLELKTKQTEEEVAEHERARAKSEAADFSIQNCIALIDTMDELSGEERADAYDIFKDIQNREIFMTADRSSRLIWLKK